MSLQPAHYASGSPGIPPDWSVVRENVVAPERFHHPARWDRNRDRRRRNPGISQEPYTLVPLKKEWRMEEWEWEWLAWALATDPVWEADRPSTRPLCLLEQ